MKKFGLISLLVFAGLIMGWVGNQLVAQQKPAANRLFSFHGELVHVRGPDEPTVTDKTKKAMIEMFEDRVGRQTLYLANSGGGLAVVPYRKNTEVRQTITGAGTYTAIRFNVNSGESWSLDGQKWKKLPEANEIPAGNYDLQLLPAKTDVYFAIRVDHISGRTWNLNRGKWEEVVEE